MDQQSTTRHGWKPGQPAVKGSDLGGKGYGMVSLGMIVGLIR